MKGFIYFSLGLISGVAASAMYFKKKYKKKADEEIESVIKAFHDERHNKKKKTDNEEGEEEGKDGVNSLDFCYEKEPVTDYTAYSGESTMGKSEESLHPTDDEPIEESDEPYEITVDDYISSSGYKTYNLTYYAGDRTFINETLDPDIEDGDEIDEVEIINDEHIFLGTVLEESGFLNNTAPIIYVRNPELHAIFQVTKKTGCYSDD